MRRCSYPVTHKIGCATPIFKTYQQQCATAQIELYQKYWRCEERDRQGGRCFNCQNGHNKGHQNKKGKVFKAGVFWAAYPLDSANQIKSFSEGITASLQGIFDTWGKVLPKIAKGECKGETRAALELHWAQTRALLYGDSRDDISSELTSHTTCICCLISAPLHPLFCGHAICQECLECFAKHERNHFELSKCPLHSHREWTNPWRASFKPPTSGLRVLSLDGYV